MKLLIILNLILLKMLRRVSFYFIFQLDTASLIFFNMEGREYEVYFLPGMDSVRLRHVLMERWIDPEVEEVDI